MTKWEKLTVKDVDVKVRVTNKDFRHIHIVFLNEKEEKAHLYIPEPDKRMPYKDYTKARLLLKELLGTLRMNFIGVESIEADDLIGKTGLFKTTLQDYEEFGTVKKVILPMKTYGV